MKFELLGDASSYEEMWEAAEQVTDSSIKSISSQLSAFKAVGTEVNSTFKTTVDLVQAVHETNWFGPLLKDSEATSSAFGKLVEDAKKWLASSLPVVDAMRNMATQAQALYASFVALGGMAGIATTISTAWAAASAITVAAITKITAATVAMTTAMMTNPLILAGIAAVGAAIAAAAVGVKLYRDHSKELQDQLYKENEAREENRTKYRKQTDEILYDISRTGDARERAAKGWAEMAKLEKDPNDQFGTAGQLDAARDTLKELEQTQKDFGKWTKASFLDFLGISDKAKTTANEIKQVKEDITMMEDRLYKINDLMVVPKETTDAIFNLRKSLQETVDLKGRTGTDAKIAHLERGMMDEGVVREHYQTKMDQAFKAGDFDAVEKYAKLADEAWTKIKQAKADIAEIKSLAAQIHQNELADQIDKESESLRHQVAVLRDGAEKVALFDLQWKLAEAGFPLEAITMMTDKLEAQREVIKQIQSDKAMEKEGEDLKKHLRTRQEVFEDTTRRLDELFQHGDIDDETYNRALAEAEEKLHGVQKAAKEAKDEVNGFNAALVGSAEAAARLDAYQNTLTQRSRFRGEEKKEKEAKERAFDPYDKVDKNDAAVPILKDIHGVLTAMKEEKADTEIGFAELSAA